jgi:hypothetical protein
MVPLGREQPPLPFRGTFHSNSYPRLHLFPGYDIMTLSYLAFATFTFENHFQIASI